MLAYQGGLLGGGGVINRALTVYVGCHFPWLGEAWGGGCSGNFDDVRFQCRITCHLT